MERLTKLKHYDDYAVRYGHWWEWKTKKGKLVTMLELNRLAEYEDTNLTPQEIVEMRADATALFKENQQLRKENEELKNQQIQLAVEKLEELSLWADFRQDTINGFDIIYVDDLERIINKIINELKGES